MLLSEQDAGISVKKRNLKCSSCKLLPDVSTVVVAWNLRFDKSHETTASVFACKRITTLAHWVELHTTTGVEKKKNAFNKLDFITFREHNTSWRLWVEWDRGNFVVNFILHEPLMTYAWHVLIRSLSLSRSLSISF